MLRGKNPLAVALGLLLAGAVSFASRAPGQEESRNNDAPEAPQGKWRLNGSIRIRTKTNDNRENQQ